MNEELKEVRIRLVGDVVEIVKCPPGVRVVVDDYDVDVEDEDCITDETGRRYIEFEEERSPAPTT